MHHIIFGECFIEDRLTARVMDCWQAGHSSLREHGPIGLHHAAVGHLDAHRPLHQRRPGRPTLAGFTGGGDGVSRQVQDPSAESAYSRARLIPASRSRSWESTMDSFSRFNTRPAGITSAASLQRRGNCRSDRQTQIVYTRIGCPTRSSEP
jgi:hypothetical protein